MENTVLLKKPYTAYWKRIIKNLLSEAKMLEAKAVRVRRDKEKILRAKKIEIEKFQ